MKIISCVWSSNKNHVDGFAPLTKLVSIYRDQKNISDPIYFLVLNGWEFFESLEPELNEKNSYLINVSSIANEYKEKYSSLCSILYEKHGGGSEFLVNNLLRWLVMSRFADGQDFLHTDCDLVLNTDTSTIESYNKSIYMHSTCFVYIKDSGNLHNMYAETLDKLLKDNTSFIEQMQKICEDESWRWGQGFVKNIDDVHEEILFYWMIKYLGLDWSDYRNNLLYIPFMQNLIPEYNLFPEILKPSDNIYNYLNGKHTINNVPMAYMHYQQNMRMMLGLYLMQDLIGIPDHHKYSPEMVHFFTALDQLKNKNYQYLETQYNCRKNKFKNNNVVDILLLSILEYCTKNQIKIAKHPSLWHSDSGILPCNLKTVLDFEYTGWGSILNRDFWFAENMFL